MNRKLNRIVLAAGLLLCISHQKAQAQIITIGDRVWYDVNRNGRQDSGEPGIAGVTVRLFADANGDNIADNATPKATSVTDANGMYSFTNVPAGMYFVQFPIPVPSGYTGYTIQSAAGVPVDKWSACNVNTGKTGTHNFTANYLYKDAGLLKNIGISGKAYNDVNGLTDNTVNGTALALGTNVYANLYNGSTFVSSVLVSNGTYTFSNLPGNTNYTISISTTAGTAGSSPVSTLPSGWVNTGEFIGTTAGNDGNVNGILAVSLGSTSVTNANFGVEQLPTPSSITAAAQPNPGGTNNATVPAATFGGTDPDGGTITAIRITAFPTGATSITINNVNYTPSNFPTGTGITIPTNAQGQPTQTILVDPASEGPSTVSIPFKVTDNAGKESSTTGTATIPFLGIIRGNIFNDVDGMTDNTVDGTGIGTASGQQLYAYLLNSSGVIIDTAKAAANGSFSFNKAAANTNYSAVITTTVATIGSSNPQLSLPTNWVNTGEFIGTTAGNDGTANGTLAINYGTTPVANANFGIEQLPTPSSITAAAQPNPGGTNNATVPAATFGGTDPDGGTVTSLRITAFPTGATSITINNVNYTPSNFPTSTGITIPTNAQGQPTQTILVDPASEGPSTVSIPFKVTDNAGKESSTTGIAAIPFLGIIRGNIFNDVDGMTDNMVDGTGIGTASGQQLYAYLLNSSGVIVDTAKAAANGSFSFNKAAANTNYTAVITTTVAAIGSSNPQLSLPTNWVNTGEQVGSGTGHDGTVNGRLPIAVVSSLITNANFGIQALPTPQNLTAATQINPGGTANVIVPATTFQGTDPDGGTISSLRITAFPTGATSVTVNNVSYTATSFPTNTGISIPTNAQGQPAQTIAVDPTSEGSTTITIPYKVTDNAGKESSTTAIATLPLLKNTTQAVNDFNNTLVNTPVSGNVLTNDEDLEGNSQTVNTNPVTLPAHGTVSLNSNGTYTYTPAAGYVGEDQFRYSVCDNGTPTACDTAVVSIKVLPLLVGGNNPPVANDDAATTLVNTPVSGNMIANDFDPDGNPITINTTPVTNPVNGTVTINSNGTYVYTPANGFVGKDSFDYRICDNGTPALCDVATVIIDVLPLTAPNVTYANDDAGNGLMNTPINGNVKTNDTDPEGNTQTVNTTPVLAPAHGTVVLNANGTYTYTPTTGYVGPDKFVYTTCDNGTPVACDQATVYLTVLAPPAPDLTPVILLPINAMNAGDSRDFVVRLNEVSNVSTSGQIAFNISVPVGYTLSIDNTATTTNVLASGNYTVTNAKWNTFNMTGRSMDLQSVPGFLINARGNTYIGFKVTRVSALSNSVSNITVNIYPDNTKRYDSNNANNLYNRVITAN